MSLFPTQGPGFGTTQTLSTRLLFRIDTLTTRDFLYGGAVLDGANTRDPDNTSEGSAYIRNGLVLGKITSASAGGNVVAPIVGQYAASIMGTLTSAITNATTQTSIVTNAVSATEISRRLGTSGTIVLTGAPTTTGTVATQSVAFSAITIGATLGTLTVTAPQTAFVAGTWIGAFDGSADPKTVFYNNAPGSAVVVDSSGANIRTKPLPLIPITTIPYRTATIINYPPATLTTQVTYLKTRLRIPVPAATFDDDF